MSATGLNTAAPALTPQPPPPAPAPVVPPPGAAGPIEWDRGATRAAHHETLWHDLANGTAGWPIRLVVTLAAAASLSGLCLILAYMLAWMVKDWNRYPDYGGVYPSDELLAMLFLIAGAGFLAVVAWVWSRNPRHRPVVYPVVTTLAAALITTVLAVWIDDSLEGDSELVVLGLVLLAGSLVLLIWLQAARNYRRGRPPLDRHDGLLDVRCPACGYRMVGLRESRCPECGAAYTLDELLTRQGFSRQP